MSYRNPAATWLGSPNYSAGRPDGIQWIVLHTMVGTTAASNGRFQNPGAAASAHYGVSEDGSLVQWVDEGDTAWHAGDYPCNQHSIGIEHEDNGDYNGVRPDALYAASSALVASICSRNGIPVKRGDYAAGIPGCIDHRTVAITACPDALDTDRIIRGAQTFGPGGGTIGGDMAQLDADLYPVSSSPAPRDRLVYLLDLTGQAKPLPEQLSDILKAVQGGGGTTPAPNPQFVKDVATIANALRKLGLP